VTVPGAQRAGIRSPGRASIGARTLRTDRWWAYPAVTFAVLLAFVAYATLLELVKIRASQINAVGLRSDVLSLDGLEFPEGAGQKAGPGGSAR